MALLEEMGTKVRNKIENPTDLFRFSLKSHKRSFLRKVVWKFRRPNWILWANEICKISIWYEGETTMCILGSKIDSQWYSTKTNDFP